MPEQKRVTAILWMGFIALNCGLLIFVDAFGFSLLRTYGPYSLFGIMVPGNVVCLGGFMIATTKLHQNTIFLSIGVVAIILNCASICYGGMLVFFMLLMLGFQCPG